MSVQQEHATSETATLTTTESGGVYQSLFDKINLTPVSSIQEIDLWQNSETLADASPDERVTAAIHVLLSCLAKSGENVVKLDKSLLDFHIDDLDQKISKQLDAVMHHPEFQKVESLWRGTWFVVQRTDFRKNVRIELLDISKEHLRQDFDDSPEIIQSGLYRHTYIQEYDTPGGEPVASLISSYEFDNSPQDIALLRNISRVSAASHMPFIGSVGPKFFLKNSMKDRYAIVRNGKRYRISTAVTVKIWPLSVMRCPCALLMITIRITSPAHWRVWCGMFRATGHRMRAIFRRYWRLMLMTGWYSVWTRCCCSYGPNVSA